MKVRNSVFFGLMLLCISCSSESEKFLEERLAKENFDFSDLKPKNNWLQSNLSNSGVEYGIISLNNAQKVKFWFVSHHLISDKGGTIYEFPDGEKKFISGMHCCEVLFNDTESLRDLSTFKNYLEANNRLKP
ncbi:hypothetical protein [Paenimyroides aestuarii]|uniref:Lipoprotein n=1 Tax=Paenimyroides aestuarii TaxID=2968490 RepID=A0ABY5NUK0_9FLAO|nr:hypothetical protein [Paenimyroides aestuarii]UUV22127.1 hypothetical protein NPX36_03525 [Paenimyroides aestuarii]